MSEQLLNRVIMVSKDLQEIYKVKKFLVTKKNDNSTAYQFDFSKVIPIPAEILESLDENHDSIQSEWCYKNWGCRWVFKGGWEHDELDTIEFLTVNGNGLLIIKELSLKFPRVLFVVEYDLIEYHDDQNLVYIKNGELKSRFMRGHSADKDLQSKFPESDYLFN